MTIYLWWCEIYYTKFTNLTCKAGRGRRPRPGPQGPGAAYGRRASASHYLLPRLTDVRPIHLYSAFLQYLVLGRQSTAAIFSVVIELAWACIIRTTCSFLFAVSQSHVTSQLCPLLLLCILCTFNRHYGDALCKHIKQWSLEVDQAIHCMCLHYKYLLHWVLIL